MKCERCGKINPAEIHTCTPEPQVNGWPLYSGLPKREWQGLTDEEIKNHWLIAMQSVEGTVLPIPEFALAIERALKQKNNG